MKTSFILLNIVIVLLHACKSNPDPCDSSQEIDQGTFYLNDQQKGWVTYSNSEVTFKNQNNHSAVFRYDSITTVLVNNLFPPTEGCFDCNSVRYIGEENFFYLRSDSFSYFNTTFELYAADPFYYHRDCSFQNGDLYMAGGGFYMILRFSDPLSLESAAHLDSIELNGNIFLDIYYNPSFMDCSFCGQDYIETAYFNKELGLVGFIAHSGDTWSLQQ